MIYSEKIALDNINRERAEIEKYKDIVFKQDNTILKLEARVGLLSKKRIESDKALDDYYAFTREIYVIDPHDSALIINDELAVYKNAYESVAEHYRILYHRVREYKEYINELKAERAATDKDWKCKTKALLLQKEKEFDLDDKTFNDNIVNSVPETDMDIRVSKVSKKNGRLKSIISTSEAKLKESNLRIQRNYNFNNITPIGSEEQVQDQLELLSRLELISEWREVVKIVGFTDEECNEIFYNNERKTKFGESVDILSSMLANKNLQIKSLLDENIRLNKEIQILSDNNKMLQLNFENCQNQLEKLKSRLDQCHCGGRSNDFNSSNKEISKAGILNSIVGTPGSITINRLNIHTSVNQYNRSENCKANFSGCNNYYNYYKNVAHPSDEEVSCDSDLETNCFNLELKREKLFNFKAKQTEIRNQKSKISSPSIESSSQSKQNCNKALFNKIKTKNGIFIQLESDNHNNKEDPTIYKDTCETTEKVGTCKSRCSSNMKGRLFQKLNFQPSKNNQEVLASEFIRIQTNC